MYFSSIMYILNFRRPRIPILFVRSFDWREHQNYLSVDNQIIFLTKKTPTKIDFGFTLSCSKLTKIQVYERSPPSDEKCARNVYLSEDGQAMKKILIISTFCF